MGEIVRVWGTADSFDIELHQNDNGRWVCSLPPDLIDGQYAVQLFAMRSNGLIGMWTGILYVSNGISCLHLKNERCTLWLFPEQNRLSLASDRITIKLIKECCQHG